MSTTLADAEDSSRPRRHARVYLLEFALRGSGILLSKGMPVTDDLVLHTSVNRILTCCAYASSLPSIRRHWLREGVRMCKDRLLAQRRKVHLLSGGVRRKSDRDLQICFYVPSHSCFTLPLALLAAPVKR